MVLTEAKMATFRRATPSVPSWARYTTILLGLAVAFGGLVALILGWWLDIEFLRAPVDGASMKANNAALAILLGIGLVLCAGKAKWAVIAICVIVALVAGWTLLENLLSLGPTAFDELLVADSDSTGSTAPGRMGGNSALGYLLASIALLLVAISRFAYLRQWVGLAVGAIAYFALLGWIIGAVELTGPLGRGTMALPTAIAQLMIAAAILVATPNSGWVAELRASLAGRRLIIIAAPIALAISVVVSALLRAAFAYGGLAAEYSATVLAVGALALALGGTTLGAALQASRIDRQRLALIQEKEEQLAERSRQLERARDGLATYLKVASVPAGMVDSKGRWVLVTSALCELLAAQETDLLGQLWFDSIESDSAVALTDAWSEYSTLGLLPNPVRVEVVSDGRRGWYDCALFSLAAPAMGHALVSLTDVTREVDRENEASEAFAVIDTSLVAMIVIDNHGRIVRCNPATETLFGYSDAELIGRNVSMLMPAPYREEHPGYLRTYLETGRRRIIGSTRDFRALRRDGREFPMTLSVSEFSVEGRKRFVGTIVDRSVQEAYRTELERSNSDLEKFAYLASHDLQAPARNVANLVRMLDDSLLDAEQDGDALRIVRMLEQSAAAMRAQIQAILKLARIQRTPPEFVRLDPGDLIADVLRIWKNELAESNAECVVQDDWPLLDADPNLLRVVFDNLIGNAIKYRQIDGTLRLEILSATHDNEVEFLVRDNGRGIEPESQARVFEMFQRLVTQQDVVGTGVGLAMAQRAVLWHHGRIWIESAGLNQGTTFHVNLPLRQEGGGDSS